MSLNSAMWLWRGGKETLQQTMVHKTLQRKIKIEQHEAN